MQPFTPFPTSKDVACNDSSVVKHCVRLHHVRKFSTTDAGPPGTLITPPPSPPTPQHVVEHEHLFVKTSTLGEITSWSKLVRRFGFVFEDEGATDEVKADPISAAKSGGAAIAAGSSPPDDSSVVHDAYSNHPNNSSTIADANATSTDSFRVRLVRRTVFVVHEDDTDEVDADEAAGYASDATSGKGGGGPEEAPGTPTESADAASHSPSSAMSREEKESTSACEAETFEECEKTGEISDCDHARSMNWEEEMILDEAGRSEDEIQNEKERKEKERRDKQWGAVDAFD
jgi:hypothetical protein